MLAPPMLGPRLFILSPTLRWLEIVSSTYILMGRYNHSLSLDASLLWYQKTAQPLVNTLLLFS